MRVFLLLIASHMIGATAMYLLLSNNNFICTETAKQLEDL